VAAVRMGARIPHVRATDHRYRRLSRMMITDKVWIVTQIDAGWMHHNWTYWAIENTVMVKAMVVWSF